MVSILNTLDSGHGEDIQDIQVDYYGLMMATCSSDRLIKIFNLKTQELITDLNGHFGPVSQLSWAHPKFGCILASCSFDKRIIIWKEDHGWIKMNEFILSSPAACIEFAPYHCGLRLACGSTDGKISILSFENGVWDMKKIQGHLLGCNSLSWDPTSNGSRYLATGGCDSCVKIWEENSSGWEEVAKLDVHQDWVLDVAWSPSTTVNMIASCSNDKTVIINTSTDKKNWTSKLLHSFPDAVYGVTWDQNILAVTTANKKVYLWKENPSGQWICMSESDIHSSDHNLHS
uniref:Protein SEC13 homolog n=1 Tax=Triatoma infestans TaxID=30076 RepID=A0A023F8A0_TRIIF